MKCASLLAYEEDLFAQVAQALRKVTDQRVSIGKSCAQFRDEGRLFNLFREDEAGLADIRTWPIRNETGGALPDIGTIKACYVECRWEEWFIEVVGSLSCVLAFPLWVLDSDGNLWHADAIDLDRLVL